MHTSYCNKIGKSYFSNNNFLVRSKRQRSGGSDSPDQMSASDRSSSGRDSPDLRSSGCDSPDLESNECDSPVQTSSGRNSPVKFGSPQLTGLSRSGRTSPGINFVYIICNISYVL